MASGMRLWLGIVLGGFLLLVVWGLPPRPADAWMTSFRRSQEARTPEWIAHTRIQVEVQRRNWVYQRLQWRDSLGLLARASRESGRMWAVALPDSAPEHYLPRLEIAVTAQLAARGIAEPEVPVGAVLMEGNVGLHPLLLRADPVSYGYEELFVSLDPEEPYCFVVDPFYWTLRALRNDWARMVWMPQDSSLAPAPLGPCALHAKYGTPGPEIFQWLRSGGYAFAQRERGYGMEGFYPERPVSRGAFGLRTSWFAYSPDGEACLAGKLEGCRRALAKGPALRSSWRAREMALLADNSPVAIQNLNFGAFQLFGGRESTLLWELQEEFGPGRFRAFWASELGVDDAFQAAFGTSFPEWVMGWAQREVGTLKASPVVPMGASLLSLLIIGGLAGAALFLGRRRG